MEYAIMSATPRGFALALLVVFRASGQPAPSPAFDVASIKASKPGPRGQIPQRITIEPGGQSFKATNARVKDLIVTAYDIADLQLSGGPGWIESEGFDIDAKAESSTTGKLIRQMLQTLLADRFKLTLHREIKELSVEAVVPAKGDLRLQPAANSSDVPGIAIRAGPGRSMFVTGQNVTLQFVAKYLSGRLRHLVVDRTGLPGSFDFRVDIAPELDEAKVPNVPEADSMSYLFRGLVQKLGFKLQAQKTPMEVFTVEHVERPVAN
jgi:uncharacterized protein (TIGR03435 family)